MLELRRLSALDGRDVYEMLQTMPADENGFINKAHGMSYEQYKLWLAGKQGEAEQKGIVDGWKVPSTTYWLYADGAPVGFGSVRHFLTDALRQAGGNIGYGIAPAFRGRGYGKALLSLLLQEARRLGIGEALITIHEGNAASLAVALYNAGRISERRDSRVYVWCDTGLGAGGITARSSSGEQSVKTLDIVGDNYFGAWTQSRTACRGIVIEDGRLLLSYESVTGQWMLPGGGLEPGEEERACCVREVAEETGLRVEPAACALEIDEYYEDWKYINRYFFCRVIGKAEMRLTERERAVGMEPRWMPVEEIRSIFAGHAAWVDTDEMRRGMYLREYTALCELVKAGNA